MPNRDPSKAWLLKPCYLVHALAHPAMKIKTFCLSMTYRRSSIEGVNDWIPFQSNYDVICIPKVTYS